MLQLFVLVYFDQGSYLTFDIRTRILEQVSSPYKVARGDMKMIKSEKEGTATLQYPLLTMSNYATLTIKM